MTLSARHAALLALYDVTRDDWDPNDNTPQKNREVDAIDRIELHHTGGAGPANLTFAGKLSWGLQIEAFHEGTKGWTDLFYHVFVFADGSTWGGRRPDRTSQSNIPTTLTVHIPGNNAWITPAQRAAILDLARWATDNPDMVRVHSDRAATQCPGANARVLRRQIQEDLATMPEHDHTYADLSGNIDAQGAHAKGFWDTSNPSLAASRSTVAVIVNRVDNAARTREAQLKAKLAAAEVRITALAQSLGAANASLNALQARVDQLNEVGNEIVVTPEVLDVIVAELQARLEE
jgi:hypothetical protein